AVHRSFGHKEHIACGRSLRHTVMLKVESSFTQADDLAVLDAVRRIRHGTRRLHGHVQGNLLAGWKPPLHHIPALAAVRVLMHGNVREAKDVRSAEVNWFDGRLIHNARRKPTLSASLTVKN